ncbi:MAG: hypothetical protein ABI207_09290 [Crocinitomicaceae bacterium]
MNITINSLIDKLVIINADGKSIDEISKSIETALNNVIKSVQENPELNLDKSYLQCGENNHHHSPE